MMPAILVIKVSVHVAEEICQKHHVTSNHIERYNLEKIIWRKVPSIKTLEASNLGDIRLCEDVSNSHKSGFIFKKDLNRYGYFKIRHFVDGVRKEFLVHRLICEAFNVNTDNKPLVLHRDANRINNIPSNLYWGSQIDNVRDRENHGNTMREDNHYARKINSYLAKEIKKYQSIGLTTREISEKTDISIHIINDIKRGRSWKRV